MNNFIHYDNKSGKKHKYADFITEYIKQSPEGDIYIHTCKKCGYIVRTKNS